MPSMGRPTRGRKRADGRTVHLLQHHVVVEAALARISHRPRNRAGGSERGSDSTAMRTTAPAAGATSCPGAADRRPRPGRSSRSPPSGCPFAALILRHRGRSPRADAPSPSSSTNPRSPATATPSAARDSARPGPCRRAYPSRIKDWVLEVAADLAPDDRQADERPPARRSPAGERSLPARPVAPIIGATMPLSVSGATFP